MLSVPRCLAAIAFALALFGCDPGAPAPPLNSERIEQVFGSYGVEVLFSDAILRVSSLYSTDDGVRTTRTLAVVAWPPVADPRLAAPQAAIQGGASIGATLEAAGWTVRKRNLFYGETPASAELGRLMRVPTGSMLATHGYSLIVERAGQSSYYATIAEIHHPDYLDLDTVDAIYGRAEPVDATTGPTIRSLVEEGLSRLAAQPSGRGE
jgi:hypothetical protein